MQPTIPVLLPKYLPTRKESIKKLFENRNLCGEFGSFRRVFLVSLGNIAL